MNDQSDPEKEAEMRGYAHQLLQQNHSLSLATLTTSDAGIKSDKCVPWAANLFFVSNRDFQIYFVSSGKSRHCRDISAEPRVAVTVSKNQSDWFEICGLQATGVAAVVPLAEREQVLELYLGKFPRLAMLYQRPANQQERSIAERFDNSDFYSITPDWLRVIDNGRGFGFKYEWNS